MCACSSKHSTARTAWHSAHSRERFGGCCRSLAHGRPLAGCAMQAWLHALPASQCCKSGSIGSSSPLLPALLPAPLPRPHPPAGVPQSLRAPTPPAAPWTAPACASPRPPSGLPACPWLQGRGGRQGQAQQGEQSPGCRTNHTLAATTAALVCPPASYRRPPDCPAAPPDTRCPALPRPGLHAMQPQPLPQPALPPLAGSRVRFFFSACLK